jgi:hypothetical protein
MVAGVALAVLLQGPQGQGVTGRVLSADSGAPIANVRILVRNADNQTPTVALTDRDGVFTVSTETFPFLLSGSKPGYGTRAVSVAKPGRVADILLAPAAVIAGRVVDDAGEPVLGARIAVEASQSSGPNSISTAETDDRGEYRVGGLAAGTYVVSVRTIGEVRGMQIRPGQIAFAPPINNQYYPDAVSQDAAQRIIVAAGSDQEGIDFTVPLNRSGNQPFSVMRDMGARRLASSDARSGARASIRGTVSSSDGRTLPFAQVLLDAVGVFDSPILARADGTGRFSFDNLMPGRYRVSASKAGYFSSGPNAAIVVVQNGESRDGDEIGALDIALERTHTAHLRGRIFGADGLPSMGGSVTLRPSRRSQSVAAMPVAARLQNGAFEFPNVPPGQYVIQAYLGRSRRFIEGEFGSLLVSVTDRDIANLALRMSKGTRATGRLRLDSADPSKRVPFSQVELTAAPVDFDQSPSSSWATADFQPDGSFELIGLIGPRRLLVAKIPPGFALEEVRVNGMEVTDRPVRFDMSQPTTSVEVVLTDRVSVLSGRVTGDDGKPAVSAPVIAYSRDRDRWYELSRFLRLTRTGEDGTYTIEGLPFGSYYAFAPNDLPSDGADAWQEPAFLEAAMRRASSFSVREGERTTLDLRRIEP